MAVFVMGLGKMGICYIEVLKKLGVKEIKGWDTDHKKRSFASGLSIDLQETPKSDDLTIVAVGTPFHHKVIFNLLKKGVRFFLCEKPLVKDVATLEKVKASAQKRNAQIFTAHLMNFSAGLNYVETMMRRDNLIVVETSVLWGKNRTGDLRPTPGDLEDELMHGRGIVYRLININQRFKSSRITSLLTYPVFARRNIQIDGFPRNPNCSSRVIERIRTDVCEIANIMHSSFIYPFQVRKVGAVLSPKKFPSNPLLSIELDFDLVSEGKIIDKVVSTHLETNKTTLKCFKSDKLINQMRAFLNVSLQVDPRLADVDEAAASVLFTEAARESSKKGGRLIKL